MTIIPLLPKPQKVEKVRTRHEKVGTSHEKIGTSNEKVGISHDFRKTWNKNISSGE